MQILPNGPLSCLKAYDEKEKKKQEVIPKQQQLFVLRAVYIKSRNYYARTVFFL